MSKNIPKPTIYKAIVASPVGYWTIVGHEKSITDVLYSKEKPLLSTQSNAIMVEARRQLTAYFDCKLTQFDLPLDLDHYSDFYKSVWSELLAIPYGTMCSYADIAIKLSNPKAVRAVGMANGKNPIPIIVPCHRVIGKDRSLTGYAHGTDIKKWLLELEGALPARPTLF